MAYLPSYYKDSAVMTTLMAANASELQLMDDKFNSVLNQFIIGLADTTLGRWENELGLPSGAGKPIDQRRAIIIAKLRGAGTTTVELLQTTAAAYTNGDIEVIEDAANSTVTIKFISVIGLPPNINDLKASIDEIIPAHLLVTYQYKYNTNDDLTQYTNNHLALFTNDQLRESDLSGIGYAMLEGVTVGSLEGV